MQNPANRGKSYSRVLRRGRRAVRFSAPAGPLADLNFARDDLERLERDAARKADAALKDPFEPSRQATLDFVHAVRKLYDRLMRASGFHLVHQAWRKRQVSAAEHLRLEGATVPATRELDRVTDLGRTAREAWFQLAAGDDPEVRRCLGVELDALRARWSDPDDPPSLEPMVDLLALAWLQSTYLDIRYAHALKHDLPAEQLAFLARLADVARQRVAELQRDLEDGRTRLVEREIERAKLEQLFREARRRKKQAPASTPGNPR